MAAPLLQEWAPHGLPVISQPTFGSPISILHRRHGPMRMVMYRPTTQHGTARIAFRWTDHILERREVMGGPRLQTVLSETATLGSVCSRSWKGSSPSGSTWRQRL